MFITCSVRLCDDDDNDNDDGFFLVTEDDSMKKWKKAWTWCLIERTNVEPLKPPNRAAAMVATGFPLGLENQEKWDDIFYSKKSQGILIRREKSGKIIKLQILER